MRRSDRRCWSLRRMDEGSGVMDFLDLQAIAEIL
jgi:hypothetical protein